MATTLGTICRFSIDVTISAAQDNKEHIPIIPGPKLAMQLLQREGETGSGRSGKGLYRPG